jgi:hypothetical protein
MSRVSSGRGGFNNSEEQRVQHGGWNCGRKRKGPRDS